MSKLWGIIERFCTLIVVVYGLPRWLSVKESTCQYREHGFHPWVRKIPWRRKWHPTLVFLPGEFHGQWSLVGYSPWGRKRVRHDLVTRTTVYTGSICQNVCIYYNYEVYPKKVGCRRNCGTIFRNNLLYIKA